MSSVCAIVVTHNRRSMLRKCLDALSAQTHPPDLVIVVDNASTDGTAAMVERDYPGVDLVALETNEGGAGGFHEGMRRGHAAGSEWLWVMDDDTIPRSDALAELLAAPDRLDGAQPPAMLASKVVWRDGRVHPMNFPTPERSRMEGVVHAASRGLMCFRAATFVSLLIHRRMIDRHGLPLKHFFIWSDDIEYTSRAVLAGDLGYLVPSSIALHDTDTAHTAHSASPGRFYFHVRNTLYIIRGPARPPRDRLLRVWVLLSSTVVYLRVNPGAASLSSVARGLRDGLRRRPGVEPCEGGPAWPSAPQPRDERPATGAPAARTPRL